VQTSDVRSGAQEACAPARRRAYVLRDRTRWIASSKRERNCGHFCIDHVDTHPRIVVGGNPKGGKRAKWKGLSTCGHVWTCPVCSQNIVSKRADVLAAALRGLGGQFQMLTGAFRHHDGLLLRDLLRGMTAAWRKTRQGGRIQRTWTRRVSASARVIEVTHGVNGWHPHFHVLLRTSEWTEDEKEALLERYKNAIQEELGDYATRYFRGLHWSEPFDAGDSHGREHYLAKFAIELSGRAKQTKRGGRSHWQIAEDASRVDRHGRAVDPASLRLWQEFYGATRGRRMFELDDRMSDAGKRQIELERAYPLEQSEEPPVTIEVKRDDVRALRKKSFTHRGLFASVLDAAETSGADAVRDWIAYAHGLAPCPAKSTRSVTLSLAS
jgi:hypothetical protein